MKRFSCEEAVELVTAFLEGELDGPALHRFEEHLGGCEGCERYLGQFRVTVEALGRLRTAEPPDRPHPATGSSETDQAERGNRADDPRHHTPGVTPGPSRQGSPPEGTRDRLLAAFRARRPT